MKTKSYFLSLTTKFKLLSFALLIVIIPLYGLSLSLLNLAKNLQLIIILIFTILLCIALGITYFFLKRAIIQPLKKISQVAIQVNQGERGVNFTCQTDDEFSILTSSLNGLKLSLEVAMDEIK